jgi:hypothetical protein
MSIFALSLILAFQDQTAPSTKPTTKPETEYLFRVKGTVGDSYSYDTHFYMSDPTAANTLEVQGVFTDTLVRQYEEQMEWKQVLSLRKISASGEMRPALQIYNAANNIPVTLVTNDRGRVLKKITGNIEKETRGSANIVFPKKAVKIGEYWDAPVEIGTDVVDIRYQLMSVTNIAGRQTAYIEGTYFPDQIAVNVEKHQFYVDVPYGRTISSKIYAVVTKGKIKLSVWATTTLRESKAGEGKS